MLVRIIAWIWIIMGALFLLKPDFLKTKLQKKGNKQIKKILMAIAVALGIMLIIASWKMQGLLSLIVLILGIIAIIKGFILIKGKLSDKLVEWVTKQSLLSFRIIASFYIIVGIVLLLGA